MKRKMQIFVSSTYTDLLDERQSAVQAILNANHIPAGMELFKSGNESQLETIYRWIDECDLYLLILGGRYGSIEPKSGKSYIHLEYDYAISHGIPVFAIVLSNKYLHRKASINDYQVFEEKNKKQYNIFKKQVMSRIVREVSSIDEMKLEITNSLHEFENDSNIKGWVKYDNNMIVRNTTSLSQDEKYLLRDKINKDIIGTKTASLDFYSSVDKRILNLARNSLFIDKFRRIIEITICEDKKHAVIQMENYYRFINIGDCQDFYRSSPVFPNLNEATSYEHLQFELNNIDCLNQIKKEILQSEKNEQFKYIVKNTYPLNRKGNADECTIYHKIRYKVAIQNFYQYHAIIYPCRDYTLEIVVKNHKNEFSLALATNEFFDIDNYVERTQYRDKHICTINYLDWLLPGSGYSFTIQQKTE